MTQQDTQEEPKQYEVHPEGDELYAEFLFILCSHFDFTEEEFESAVYVDKSNLIHTDKTQTWKVLRMVSRKVTSVLPKIFLYFGICCATVLIWPLTELVCLFLKGKKNEG